MNNKLVSVNITTYNRAHLLPRCLDSVLSQSYDNMEVIIVDDCSSDNTTEVVKEYQQKDSRIKYIKHETNQKLPTARNTAWKNSLGEYIAFMDDDDEWMDKDKIKKQVKIFENSDDEKLALISTSVRLYSDENSFEDKIIQKPKNLKSHILSRNGIMYTPTVMTKRSVIEKVGGFDTNLPRGIDSDFYRMCIVKYGYDVCFMEDVTTGIHEYGGDRMTFQITEKSLKISMKSHCINLKKYFKYYLLYPEALFFRLKSLVMVVYKYIKGKF
ncbi:MAG: glycosyltransferase family 2 protein [Campylobacterota bacterium]